MKRKIVVLLLVFNHTHLYAQSSSTQMGGRVIGLARAAATLTDEWSVFNNPAGLAGVQSTSAAFSMHHAYGLVGANKISAAILHPVSFGTIGLSTFRFGDALYNEQLASLAFSNQVGITNLGIRADYIQYRGENVATQAQWGITFGGITKLSTQFSIGAYIRNLNQPKLPSGEKLPVNMVLGVGFQPTQQFLLVTELEKKLTQAATLKMAMEYHVHKKMRARTGFNLYPNTAFFGLGFSAWRIIADVALEYSLLLSASQHVSLTYQLEKRKRK